MFLWVSLSLRSRALSANSFAHFSCFESYRISYIQLVQLMPPSLSPAPSKFDSSDRKRLAVAIFHLRDQLRSEAFAPFPTFHPLGLLRLHVVSGSEPIIFQINKIEHFFKTHAPIIVELEFWFCF